MTSWREDEPPLWLIRFAAMVVLACALFAALIAFADNHTIGVIETQDDSITYIETWTRPTPSLFSTSCGPCCQPQYPQYAPGPPIRAEVGLYSLYPPVR